MKQPAESDSHNQPFLRKHPQLWWISAEELNGKAKTYFREQVMDLEVTERVQPT
jgi:hypothetical protein